MDCSPPGYSIHGILQARILEWVAIPSSRGPSRSKDRSLVSCLLHWQAGSLLLALPGKRILLAQRSKKIVHIFTLKSRQEILLLRHLEKSSRKSEILIISDIYLAFDILIEQRLSCLPNTNNAFSHLLSFPVNLNSL